MAFAHSRNYGSTCVVEGNSLTLHDKSAITFGVLRLRARHLDKAAVFRRSAQEIQR